MFPSRKKKLAVGALALVGVIHYLRQSSSHTKKEKARKRSSSNNNKKKFSSAMLQHVLRRAVGKRECVDLAMLSTVLLGRSILSVAVANNMGLTIKKFCNKDWPGVRKSVVQFTIIGSIASVINSCLKYYVDTLGINVRERLTHYCHEKYFENMNYYKANKVGERKLENADQLMAEDIEKFSESLSEVYSQMLKPVVDFVLFSVKLGSLLGPIGPFGMYFWFATAATISTSVLPPFGRLAAREQVLEGRFRAAHANVIQNSEMIAFMGGEIPEKRWLNDSFNNLRQHIKGTLQKKFKSDCVHQFVNKYFASVFGFALNVAPVFFNIGGKWKDATPGEIASFYVSCRQIMEGLALSVLAIFELQKRIGKLSGLTSRIETLMRALERPEPILQDLIDHFGETNPARITEGDTLCFENVSIYKPDGILLVKDLNFNVNPGDRIIVTGTNGCGKSSLFRVIRGLWPLVNGNIVKPPNSTVFFLSQVNFVPKGTLRDIIIYPHSVEEAKKKVRGDLDENLQQALQWAHLGEGEFECDNRRPTLDDNLEWDTALSPGQKQRMAFARLLYHLPQYAVLDECTNGISPDVERDLYDRCRSLGMAVFSISHKIELKELHDYELHYHHDRAGSYTLTKLQN